MPCFILPLFSSHKATLKEDDRAFLAPPKVSKIKVFLLLFNRSIISVAITAAAVVSTVRWLSIDGHSVDGHLRHMLLVCHLRRNVINDNTNVNCH